MSELRIEVVKSAARWAQVESHWRGLFGASPSASPPLRWEWLWHWWDVYGPAYAAGPEALRVLLAWRGDALVGALPLYLAAPRAGRPKVLRLLSTGEDEADETCADWLDLLATADERTAVTHALARQICTDTGREAGEVDFHGIAVDSALAAVAQHLTGCGWWRDELPLGPCWQADLSAGLEGYLENLSRTTRSKCRKMLRAAERGEARLVFAATREEALACFDDLTVLHQRRWALAGKPGVFASDRFTRFHKALVAALEPGTEVSLARLMEGDEPIAVKYGFMVGDKLDCYQAGTVLDGSCATKSPGMTGYLLLIAALEPLGVKTVDLLLGEAPHKVRLCKPRTHLTHIRLARPGLRFGVHLLVKKLRSRGRSAATPAEPSEESQD